MRLTDTIVAPITGLQPAAVAWIRLSGAEALSIARRVFPSLSADADSHRAVFGRLVTGDEGLALPFAEGRSYTGETTVEISLHGSPASVRALIEACVSAGARLAEPGEFTRRAVLNGRMDLTQAEAVDDTIRARTSAQLEQANLHRSGALRAGVRELRQAVLVVLAALEASVDFSEEVGDLDRPWALAKLSAVSAKLQELQATESTGRILREGLRVAIAGPPNAGKSSLFNRLVGEDRVIVTAIAGTTRDVVSEPIEVQGLPVILFDTAGLRETEDEVETLGVFRARSQIERADLVWYVIDASVGPSEQDLTESKELGTKGLRIANKADLTRKVPSGWHPVSAVTGEGLEVLFESVVSAFGTHDVRRDALVNMRQGPLLRQALEGLDLARQALLAPTPDDLATVGLHQALQALGEVTGESAGVDVLDEVFRLFCIGK